MKMKKADWVLVKEAEREGRMVAMTPLVERNRTPLNEELSKYFREKLPKYKDIFDEDEGEDILYNINEYMKENNIDKYTIHFPFSSGTDVHLIPITENLQLKVVVADEYYGDGEYSKYVMIDFFMINDYATKKDVDVLIDFVQKNLTI